MSTQVVRLRIVSEIGASVRDVGSNVYTGIDCIAVDRHRREPQTNTIEPLIIEKNTDLFYVFDK